MRQRGERHPKGQQKAQPYKRSWMSYLAQLSHDHESMKYRHRLCTHDKMFNNVNVSKRVTSIVENSLLSDTYATHQPELSTVSVDYISSEELSLTSATEVKRSEQYSTHVVSDGSMTYIKEYGQSKNTSVLAGVPAPD